MFRVHYTRPIGGAGVIPETYHTFEGEYLIDLSMAIADMKKKISPKEGDRIMSYKVEEMGNVTQTKLIRTEAYSGNKWTVEDKVRTPWSKALGLIKKQKITHSEGK